MAREITIILGIVNLSFMVLAFSSLFLFTGPIGILIALGIIAGFLFTIPYIYAKMQIELITKPAYVPVLLFIETLLLLAIFGVLISEVI